LRVAVFTGNPVIGRRDPATGELSGTTAALTRALAAEARVPLALVEYTAIAKVVEDAKGGTWDLAVLALDPARRGILDFAPPQIAVDLTYPCRWVDVAQHRRGRPAGRAHRRRAPGRHGAPPRAVAPARVAPAGGERAGGARPPRARRGAGLCAEPRLLLGLTEKLPGSRVLDDRFSVAALALALRKGGRQVRVFTESEWRQGDNGPASGRIAPQGRASRLVLHGASGIFQA
jgi:polar amino acid transport system substrate-binding protein